MLIKAGEHDKAKAKKLSSFAWREHKHLHDNVNEERFQPNIFFASRSNDGEFIVPVDHEKALTLTLTT